MPVEVAAAAAATTMEITVSKFELLRELTATQGVVERKTTIPILSNYLFERRGEVVADGNGSGSEPADVMQREGEKRRGVHNSGAQTSRLCKVAAGCGDYDPVAGESLVSIRCGRSNTKMVGMAKSNFPGLPVFQPRESSGFQRRCCDR